MNYDTMSFKELLENYVSIVSKIDLKWFSIESADSDENSSLKAISYYNRCLDSIKENLENRYGYTVE